MAHRKALETDLKFKDLHLPMNMSMKTGRISSSSEARGASQLSVQVVSNPEQEATWHGKLNKFKTENSVSDN